MRAGIAAGNPTAVEAAYHQLIAITEADEGPDSTDLLDPETTQLYEQHRRLRYHRPQLQQPQPPGDDTPNGQS